MDSSNQQCNNNTPRSSTQKNNDSSKKRKLQTFHINIPIMHRPPNESQSMSFNKYRAYCQKEFSIHKKKMREIEDVISSSGGIVPESIRNLNLNYATNNNSKGSSSEEGEDGQEWSWEDFDSNLEFLPEDYGKDVPNSKKLLQDIMKRLSSEWTKIHQTRKELLMIAFRMMIPFTRNSKISNR
mmetsp:Transcript_31875/g.37155  ORF Transcript_31875/g.37155 Transcript_31875/m.37155 type:complete len:183 (+) Transcript_31875:119-667(+)